MGILYIVATPIGNLKDITLRALETLKSVDLILAEDTRVTKKLLISYSIKKPISRYDERTDYAKCKKIAERLTKGEKIALVTDAGTPGISDPGWRLVQIISIEAPEIDIVPIPGPSSVITALSVSGISGREFSFLGYPPHKKGRNIFFKKLALIEIRPIIFFESSHRIKKAFESMAEFFGETYRIMIFRELTKIYEEIWCGTLEEAKKHFIGEKTKGEFVIIIK